MLWKTRAKKIDYCIDLTTRKSSRRAILVPQSVVLYVENLHEINVKTSRNIVFELAYIYIYYYNDRCGKNRNNEQRVMSFPRARID